MPVQAGRGPKSAQTRCQGVVMPPVQSLLDPSVCGHGPEVQAAPSPRNDVTTGKVVFAPGSCRGSRGCLLGPPWLPCMCPPVPACHTACAKRVARSKIRVLRHFSGGMDFCSVKRQSGHFFLDFVCCSFVFWLGVCLDFPFDSKNCHETSVSLENIFEKIQKKFEMVCGSGIAGKAQKCAAAANE